MATYVLVHGAWHGGWCWQRVAKRLRDAGHQVFTPTLTGLGERSHLFHPEIGIDTHIDDVAKVFEFEDLRDAILVGHSYGGAVVTGATEKVAHRMRHLVYLDALVPQDGQTVGDAVGPAAAAGFSARVVNGGVMPLPVAVFGLLEPADIAWVEPRLVPHPAGTMLHPLQIRNPAAAALPRTYVYCSVMPMGLFEPYAEMAKQKRWNYHELATGHDAMITAPDDVTRILLALA